MRAFFLVMIIFLLISVSIVAAQDVEILPERIEVTAEDGLTLVGDYYAVPDAAGELPGVLLLHGSTSSRHEWETLIGPLLEGGFNVLAVDQRAHGETGGDRDMIAMIGDVQTWLIWMRQQPTVGDDSIAIIGSSMGTVPALAGCAWDAACMTAIAISPGDFPLLDDTLFEEMSERGILFVVGRQDNVLYDTRKLFDRTVGEAVFYVYNTALHGTAFFSPRSAYKNSATKLIMGWLDDQLQRAA